jgi:hypothetical protein
MLIGDLFDQLSLKSPLICALETAKTKNNIKGAIFFIVVRNAF